MDGNALAAAGGGAAPAGGYAWRAGGNDAGANAPPAGGAGGAIRGPGAGWCTVASVSNGWPAPAWRSHSGSADASNNWLAAKEPDSGIDGCGRGAPAPNGCGGNGCDWNAPFGCPNWEPPAPPIAGVRGGIAPASRIQSGIACGLTRLWADN